ncbi:MAG: hypothetical protein KBC96_11615 [Armatimonadetes bacterium]|nr:hypothetical protein [Armatimonadota bacterium]
MANAPSTGKWRFVLIVRVVGTTLDATTTRYYHFDALGSTRFLTDGSGTVTDTYTYDAWGKQTASTGSTAQPYRFVGQLGYYSHYQDSNLFDQSGYQFLQLGVRFYDALSGRFTQRDPARHGIDSYMYVEGRPTIATDPQGLKSYWEYEKEFLGCVWDCLGIPSVAGASTALGSALGNCFKNGKWIGFNSCAKLLCDATKKLAKVFRSKQGGGGLRIGAQRCLLVAELTVVACEGYCYYKLLR